MDLVAEVTGDDHFGLRFGATYAFDNASVLGYILRNSPNIGAAIRNAARYVRVHVDGLQLSLMFAGREARLVYRLTDPSTGVSRHYAELLMVHAMHVFRLAADESWSPDEIWFRHGPPADLAPYQRYSERASDSTRASTRRYSIATSWAGRCGPVTSSCWASSKSTQT